MSEQNRRNILAMIGLSSAAAVSTEALANRGGEYPIYCPVASDKGPEVQDSIASALENLARSIRNRDALAISLVASSTHTGEEFLSHEIKITVELPAEQSDVRVPKQIRMAEEKFAEARKTLEDARIEAKRIIDAARHEAIVLRDA
jgi:hypothetical protein